MKSVLISIQPKWCELIASGKKTIEVRKSKPKLQTPFKCYIYCTKSNSERLLHIIKDGEDNYGEIYHGKPIFIKGEDGSIMDMHGKRQKVIGEFVCDRIYKLHSVIHGVYALDLNEKNVQENLTTGLTVGEAYEYGKGKPLYGWHISDLKIYDKPKELGEFYRPVKYNADGPICGTEKEMQDIIEWDCETVFNKESTECTLKDCPRLQELYRFTNPPQSWGYVEK